MEERDLSDTLTTQFSENPVSQSKAGGSEGQHLRLISDPTFLPADPRTLPPKTPKSILKLYVGPIPRFPLYLHAPKSEKLFLVP